MKFVPIISNFLLSWIETNSESVNNSVGSKEEASTNIQEFVPPGSSKYIMGPMVMRLLPNGSPVPGKY